MQPIAYDGTRTPLKTTLFLLVCAAWIRPGLVGHDPWKTDEAIVFGAVHEVLATGDWTVFRIAGEPYFERAPLYLWIAALGAKAFGGLLPLHDAARLASGFFMAATLGLVSAASRELLGERAMRVAVLLLIGCLGLLIRAHEMSADLAGLSGIALALYGLALSQRQSVWGGVATGLGMGIAFLGDGFLPLAMLAALVVVLPATAPGWRTRSYGLAALIAFACAAPLVAAYPMMLAAKAPVWLQFWINHQSMGRWSEPFSRASLADLVYFVKVLPWYAWPAWPLAAWSIWRSRRMLATRKAIQLPLVAFVVFLVVLSLFGEAREVNAMPLLLPLVILGVAELDSVPRGGASALDWFGVTTFFLTAALIWIGWIAVMTGRPEGALSWIRNEVPGFRYAFSFVAFALASLLTLIWLVVVARSLRSTRRALVNWAAGITMVWMLMMTLGLPLVDQARSYRAVSSKLVTALPPDFHCIAQRNLGDAQRALLDYFIGMRAIRVDVPAARRCKALLVQAAPDREPPALPGWRERWRGSRPGDRHEVFILYERSSSPRRRARSSAGWAATRPSRCAPGSRCWRWRSSPARPTRARAPCSPAAVPKAPAAGSSTSPPIRSTGAHRARA
jgi:4-amino-4-deoxy-L-arabinose transferase-like glycosyltransferase